MAKNKFKQQPKMIPAGGINKWMKHDHFEHLTLTDSNLSQGVKWASKEVRANPGLLWSQKTKKKKMEKTRLFTDATIHRSLLNASHVDYW